MGVPAPEHAAAAGRRPGVPPRRARHCHRADSSAELSWRVHSSPGRERRPLLPHQQGGRTGIHRRGRRDPGAVRIAGGDGHRQRPGLSGRAACPCRSGDPGRHLASWGGSVRREDRRTPAVQSRGTADGCGPGPVGPLASGGAADDDGPVSRRRGVVVRGAAACAGAGGRGGRAGRRVRALGAGRPQHQDPGQRHADPRRGRRGRFPGGHHSGPGTTGGTRTPANRVPEHGEPRAAGAADLDPGLDPGPAHRDAGTGSRRGARVPPSHRRAGRTHAWPHRRPPRCGAHRLGHAVGHPAAFGGGRSRGPRKKHLPQRRRPARHQHRSSGRPASW